MYLFSLLYGIFAALGALALQFALDAALPFDLLAPLALKATTPLVATLSLLLLALTEEALKAAAVAAGIQSTTALHRAYLHALFVGGGFTLVEWALIALVPYDANPFATGAFLGDVIIHLCSPLVIALLFNALRTWSAAARILSTLLIVTLLHTSYNILAYAGYAPTSAPQLLFLGAFLGGTLYAMAAAVLHALHTAR